MGGFKKNKLYKGSNSLSNFTTTTCTLADTYYRIGGDWSFDITNYGFVSDGMGTIICNTSDVDYLLNGVSDLNVNTACKIHYGLYVNGVLLTGTETPHDFTSPAKVGNISITGIIDSNKSDYFEVYCKSDVAGTIITHNTLMLTFWGDK